VNFGLHAEKSLCFSLCWTPEFRWDEQLGADFLRSFGDSRLYVKTRGSNGGDDDIDAGESALERFFVGIVDWDDLGIAVDGRL